MRDIKKITLTLNPIANPNAIVVTLEDSSHQGRLALGRVYQALLRNEGFVFSCADGSIFSIPGEMLRFCASKAVVEYHPEGE